MRSLIFSTAALLAALVPSTVAQTHTDCNPLEKKGCPNNPALGGNATFHFNATMNEKIWLKKNQGLTSKTIDGANFTIERKGDSPQIVSQFYMLFGRLEVVMKAAKGRGIVSSAILQSEALDEIDWEFLGTNKTHALTNYFGKGNTTDFTRGKEYEMDPPQDDFHNYTIDWTKDRVEWWLDDQLLRTLKPDEALGGKNYPQTPMNVRLGAWAGGDVDNNDPGVVEWAGGETNFDEGPFIMTVKSVYVEDYTKNVKEYSWADMDASGSWEKIKIIQGESKALEQVTDVSTKERWNGLSKNAKIGIVVGVLSFVAIVALGIFLYFLKQRRQGRKEYAAYMADQSKEQDELLQYKNQMQSGRFAFGNRA